MEQVLRYYDDYMSHLCTRTLYGKNDNKKTAVNQRKTAYSGCSGTPGETRTHYIPLRRRTLYPGEVRRQRAAEQRLRVFQF